MTRKERYAGVTEWFRENMASPQSELNFSNPFQLLVAVILSAQCTDKRVNLVTGELFRKYPTPRHLAAACREDVLELVGSVSYPNSKAAHLVDMAGKLVSDFGGEVPEEIEDLMSLPGVGRKTANVVASIVYDKPVIAVDTHVFRVSHRIGLSSGKTPFAVECDLEKNIPPQDRGRAHHWLILHGRYVCKALKPQCRDCGIKNYCKDYERRVWNDNPDR